jgi:hypothetical protein
MDSWGTGRVEDGLGAGPLEKCAQAIRGAALVDGLAIAQAPAEYQQAASEEAQACERDEPDESQRQQGPGGKRGGRGGRESGRGRKAGDVQRQGSFGVRPGGRQRCARRGGRRRRQQAGGIEVDLVEPEPGREREDQRGGEQRAEQGEAPQPVRRAGLAPQRQAGHEPDERHQDAAV